jgi:hypothetical protein
MICVDVCFMKEKLGWQLHAAIARDANDDIFSIAYAICETENRDTWTWFLKLLLEDIGYSWEHMWSFMSNRQKVIFNAIVLRAFKYNQNYFNMFFFFFAKIGAA